MGLLPPDKTELKIWLLKCFKLKLSGGNHLTPARITNEDGWSPWTACLAGPVQHLSPIMKGSMFFLLTKHLPYFIKLSHHSWLIYPKICQPCVSWAITSLPSRLTNPSPLGCYCSSDPKHILNLLLLIKHPPKKDPCYLLTHFSHIPHIIVMCMGHTSFLYLYHHNIPEFTLDSSLSPTYFANAPEFTSCYNFFPKPNRSTHKFIHSIKVFSIIGYNVLHWIL